MTGTVDARLKELGIEVPQPAKAVANYVGYVTSGNTVFVSGQITAKDGEILYKGKLGDNMSVEEGQEAARLCGINIIAQLYAATDGNLDRVKRIVKLGGFVNSTPDFVDQPKVINGVSDLMVEVFGDKGVHARAAVSAPSLPLGIAVEVDCVAEID
ncbi:endoribonuclease [Kiloniella litopenaei]|jgi:enamine deaminase RidA (YjgF/YER057c/UK114 family)|uniref:Endoribonuclease n=1 Tax=Kiloniella litopenaei TaxID=1549748 RepID=A0A0M2REA3_9PROT|nr:RidA family protein [Kiloniella litopenaei]KKJ78345.1 endoribonuclease [Kiloniella litopenaei]